ncbi:MAG: hypothetical protein Q9M24_04650 [Mariprofundaceae bacterium]|nr:hypothetical protein [Mariprofundaceae bacterium]
MFRNDTLIVSKRIIAAHQLANMMEANGFFPKVEHNNHVCRAIVKTPLSVLITDIDDPDIRGLEIARWHLAHRPELAWFALCSGGNVATMQEARLLMAGGFFFLSESGLALDSKRGAAQFLHGNHGSAIHHGMNTCGHIKNIPHRPMIATFQPYYT